MMPVHNVYLRNYVARGNENAGMGELAIGNNHPLGAQFGENHLYTELAPVLTRKHNRGCKVNLIGFNEQIVGTNHLGRQATPWYNPNQPNEFFTAEQLVLNSLPKNVQQCVYAVCFMKGDRQNTITLTDDVHDLWAATCYWTHAEPRNRTIWNKICELFPGDYDHDLRELGSHLDSLDRLYGGRHIDPRTGFSAAACWKLNEEYEKSAAWVFQGPTQDDNGNPDYDKAKISIANCVKYRAAWRRMVGSNVDCRTYAGQPDRDMNLANAA